MLLNCIDILVTANVLPVLKAQFWDTSAILSDGGRITPLISSLIGYRATPSLIDVLGYFIYWIGVFYFINTKKIHSKKVIS
jgi:high-affinity iron transporter